jgi:hypothetical protein
MVITRLIGGLGNQLFQYAAARRVAYLSNLPLRLDTTAFEQYQLHAYSLWPFNLAARVATSAELRPYRRTPVSVVSKRLQQLFPVQWRHYVLEPHFHFAPEILAVRGSVYMSGYWQSASYFADVASLIRDEVQVISPPEGRDAELLAIIESCAAVSVHVRRGDYVGNATHGLCSPDYYMRGMARVREAEPQARFFLFSDDPRWAREVFGSDPAVFIVDHNGPDKNYEDFRLMSSCRHHIIANSTFSWWAAWLSRSSGKMVIAPARWFETDALDTSDLLPGSWIRL